MNVDDFRYLSHILMVHPMVLPWFSSISWRITPHLSSSVRIAGSPGSPDSFHAHRCILDRALRVKLHYHLGKMRG